MIQSMNKDGTIDFTKLEKQLLVAVEEDAKYQRENDAKFRAVAQRVGSYEEFKDIVAASHLKPLDKKDTEGLHNRKQPWNPYADKTNQQTVSLTNTSKPDDLSLPQNSHEFHKYWRKCQRDNWKRYRYLIAIGGPLLAEIFRAEISMGLLGEVISTMHELWQEEDLTKICSILHSLSTVKRFSLSLQFLSKKEKTLLIELFRKMNETIASLKDTGGVFRQDMLQTLEINYGVKHDVCE